MRSILIVAFVLLLAFPAFAQPTMKLCARRGQNNEVRDGSTVRMRLECRRREVEVTPERLGVKGSAAVLVDADGKILGPYLAHSGWGSFHVQLEMTAVNGVRPPAAPCHFTASVWTRDAAGRGRRGAWGGGAPRT